MTDAGYVIAAYGVIIGGLGALHASRLWRRLRRPATATTRRDDGRRARRAGPAAAAAAVGDPRPRRGRAGRHRLPRLQSVGNALVYYLTPTELLALDDAVGRDGPAGRPGARRAAIERSDGDDLIFVLTDGETEITVHSTVGADPLVPRGHPEPWSRARLGHARRLRGDAGHREARRELRGAGARRRMPSDRAFEPGDD